MRNRRMVKGVLLATVALVSVLGAKAEEKTAGFQLSLVPDIALHDRDTRIKGVSIGIWNENPVSGWSIGIVNGFTGDSYGFAWAPYVGVLNYAENFKGVQWAWVNVTKGSFVGWQDALVNYAGDCTGLQSAFVNYAGSLHGVQFGVVNYTRTVSGWAFQLGLVNVIADNPWFSNFPDELAQGFVIANWSFGGDE